MIIANAVEKLRSITPLPTQEEVTHFSPSLRSFGRDFEKFSDLIQQYDQKRYGMPLLELQEIVHSDALQRQFPERFGISFVEYAQRFLSGESMGDSLRDGIFQPAETKLNVHVEEPANTIFIEKLIANLADRMRIKRP